MPSVVQAVARMEDDEVRPTPRNFHTGTLGADRATAAFG